MTLDELHAMLAAAQNDAQRTFWATEIAYAEALRDFPPPRCPTCEDIIAPDGFCTPCLLRDSRTGKL